MSMFGKSKKEQMMAALWGLMSETNDPEKFDFYAERLEKIASLKDIKEPINPAIINGGVTLLLGAMIIVSEAYGHSITSKAFSLLGRKF